MTEHIGLAADHGGRQLKQFLMTALQSQGVALLDLGVPVQSSESVDYPDYASKLCKKIIAGDISRGILLCGTGIGMSIAANKWPGIRAALVWDEFTARMAKAHNNAQVLCLGERVVTQHRAVDYVNLWLNTDFEGERHQKRLNKINEITEQN